MYLILHFMLFSFLSLLAVQILIYLESKNPEKAISWLAILAISPFMGGMLYFLLGCSALRDRINRLKYFHPVRRAGHTQRQIEDKTDEDVDLEDGIAGNKRLTRLLFHVNESHLSKHNRITVLTNGEKKFEALFKDLEAAQNHIHLEYYIFRSDSIGEKVQNLLIKKAKSGVSVRLILDGLGSRHLSTEFILKLKEAKVEVSWFFPLKFPQMLTTLNYRNHRKLVIIDGKIAYLGGINIGDEYLSQDASLGFWRDTHLRLEGESVHSLQDIFLDDWYLASRQELRGEFFYPIFEASGESLTQVIAGGPDSRHEAMKELYFTILVLARREILLTTPYFIPDESMCMALKSAALSGIKVRILVQGRPDQKLPYLASTSYFEDLLKSGVEIFRYNKGILHSKVLTIDEELSVVGSANFDIRSFQLDFELSALIYSKELAERLNADFYLDLKDSVQLDSKILAQRSIWQRVQEANARLLSPLL